MSGRDDYEERRAARTDRLRARADKADAESETRYTRASNLARAMNGQPILVGHHSEKRHRRDIARMDSDMRKSIDLDKKAKDLRRRAASAEDNGAISSDDPQAIAKLRGKLASLSANRDLMKRINAAWRKAGKPDADNQDGWRTVADTVGMDPNDLRRTRHDMARDPMNRAPFSYHLTNLGANIRRVRDRIQELEREDAQPETQGPIRIGPGYSVTDSPEQNRILFEFDMKPPREVCRIMRRHGWKFSRQLMAWCRLRNANSRAAVAPTCDAIGRVTS
jgi:hypothetical protein